MRSRIGTRTAVQSPCNDGTQPGGRTDMGNGEKKHSGTEEVNMKTRTPRDAHGVQDEWLTVDEVCTELKISRRTFDRWRAVGTGPKAKRLNGNGPVRVRRSWLDEWLDTPDKDIA